MRAVGLYHARQVLGGAVDFRLLVYDPPPAVNPFSPAISTVVPSRMCGMVR